MIKTVINIVNWNTFDWNRLKPIRKVVIVHSTKTENSVLPYIVKRLMAIRDKQQIASSRIRNLSSNVFVVKRKWRANYSSKKDVKCRSRSIKIVLLLGDNLFPRLFTAPLGIKQDGNCLLVLQLSLIKLQDRKRTSRNSVKHRIDFKFW